MSFRAVSEVCCVFFHRFDADGRARPAGGRYGAWIWWLILKML